MKPRAEELQEIPLGESRYVLPVVGRNRLATRTDFATSLLWAAAAFIGVVFVIKKILR